MRFNRFNLSFTPGVDGRIPVQFIDAVAVRNSFRRFGESVEVKFNVRHAGFVADLAVVPRHGDIFL